ncbi:hypothetical protein RM572_21685 [Streptomyces sp. DSM 42041]|uniref:Antitoxin VbhA domain-containing protein n=1 Tax=Streptomyces hazeniae TaxID=3075538 RepID=A0ABU2NWL1_9ACTN|nr:hypothetical protein [Streptomyces sp. DSM 42041]MDT0381373.1 hypothetical protein [Streptomyces sp. DSM 42041]
MNRRPVTREAAISAAARALTAGVAKRAAMSPREAAEAAYYPGHPLGSVDAIETEILRRRKAAATSPARTDRAA